MRPTKFTSLACAVVFAVSLSACGSSSGSANVTKAAAAAVTAASAVDTSGPSTSAADAGATKTDEQKALALAKCMRDEGIDFPDPTVGADGSITFGGAGGGGGARAAQQTGFQAAITKCQPLAEGASFLPKQSDLTSMQDSLLKLAKCLRGKGFTVTDPDLSGGAAAAAGSPLGPNFDPQDPKNQTAITECQKELNITLPGPGGAPAGSGSGS